MTRIRIYRDAWHGAVHEFHPLTGARVRSLRAPASAQPNAATTVKSPADAAVRNWLDPRRP